MFVPVLLAVTSIATSSEVDYSRDVRPILAAKCFVCHGPDPSSREANLRLDLREGALADLGDGFHAIVPGDPDGSEAIFRVQSEDADLRMPPKGEPLTEQEIKILRRWIADGAPYANHWAYEPMRAAEPPAFQWKAASDGAPGVIDAFIAQGLDRADLAPSREADRRTLIRRATFDLTGLPPTVEEVEAFLADGSPGAYERLVDRLLDSPAYGERWARHWLDVARYADSNGVDENTAFANAHRYRDWVVSAFNANMPFDRFARLQLAGDLLPEMDDPSQAPDALAATGFLAIGPKVLAEPDKEKMVFDLVDEQIDTFGKAFLGQTISCARCHDHKFDPISQESYFALVGVFKSTRTMSTLQTVARALERGAESRGEAEARRDHAARSAAAAKALEERRAAARRETQLGWIDRLEPLLAAASSLPPPPPAREAEDGVELVNLLVDRDRWGIGIGVVRSTGEGSGRAEWTFTVESPGAHALRVRYASDETRPVAGSLAGGVVAARARGAAPRAFLPPGPRGGTIAQLDLEAGEHRVVFASDIAFPHLDRIALVPTAEIASLERSADELAAAIGAPRDVLLALAAARTDHPGLAAWRDGGESASSLAVLARGLLEDPEATATDDAEKSRREGVRAALFDPGGALADEASIEAAWSREARDRIASAEAEVAGLAASQPPMIATVLAVEDHAEPTDVALHVRGDHTNAPGPPIPRGVPRSLSGAASIPEIPAGTSGRRQLAEWMLDPEHPLTARVFVNRVWHWHFGRGLVDTPSDFGTRGGSPSHPELLDRLALDFIASGWDVKALHRRIMNSTTYRQASQMRTDAAAIDPSNRLLWRFEPRRLEAEAIRDAMLATSGRLDRTMGGSLLAVGNFEYVTNDQSGNAARYDTPRRSLYLPVIRNAIYPFFATFDYTDAGISEGCRARTVIAPQALFMLNSPFVDRQAEAWAARLIDRAPDEDARIRLAHLEAFGRAPSIRESMLGSEFLASMAPLGELEAWSLYAQVLLATSEFITLE
ncbi:MAG: DUF1553 domain-containing protein [Phycisphaerales bacterium]